MRTIADLDEAKMVAIRLSRGAWYGLGPEPLWLYVPRAWPRTVETARPAPAALVAEARRAAAAQLTEDRAGSRRPRAMAGESVPASSGEFPPLADQARNLAGAVVQAVKGGLARTTPAERAERLAICGGCEFFTIGGKCRKCGCTLRRKVAFRELHCPLDPPKW